MKTQIIITIITVTILSMIMTVNALDAGESMIITFDDTVRNCQVFGDNYNSEGITLIEDDNKVTVQAVVNFRPDTITLICEVKQTQTYSSGGTSRRTIYKTNTVYDTETVYVDVPIVTDDEDDGIDPIVITPPEPEGNLNWLLILVGALAFVLFLIIIYFIGKKADKDEKKADKADDLLDSLYDKDIEY